MNMAHFETLRERVLGQLVAVGGNYGREQIDRYPWFYGALGAVPAPVMFVCENPSLAGVCLGLKQQGALDIETQWGGGEIDNPAKRFRPVLVELGLKDPPPQGRGGWRCYITNVIKQANIVNEQNIDGAIFFAECFGGVRSNRVDEIVRKLLGRNIQNI